MAHSTLSLEARGNLSGFLTIMMWSASGLLLAMTANIPPFLLALFTLPAPFIATAAKWIILKEDYKQHFKHPLYVYLVGVLGIGGYTVLWYLGFKYAPPFEANLINYMWPFLILVFAWVFLKERMTFSQIIGVLAAFGGLIYLFYDGSNGLQISESSLWGYGFAFAGALVWAVYSVVTKKIPGFGSDVIAICCLISGVPILIMHLMFESFVMPTGLEWVGLVGLVFTRVSYLFWNFAMKYGKIEVVVGISYFTPLFSSILLIVFQYASNVGVAAALIIFGAIALSWNYVESVISPQFEKN